MNRNYFHPILSVILSATILLASIPARPDNHNDEIGFLAFGNPRITDFHTSNAPSCNSDEQNIRVTLLVDGKGRTNTKLRVEMLMEITTYASWGLGLMNDFKNDASVVFASPINPYVSILALDFKEKANNSVISEWIEIPYKRQLPNGNLDYSVLVKINMGENSCYDIESIRFKVVLSNEDGRSFDSKMTTLDYAFDIQLMSPVEQDVSTEQFPVFQYYSGNACITASCSVRVYLSKKQDIWGQLFTIGVLTPKIPREYLGDRSVIWEYQETLEPGEWYWGIRIQQSLFEVYKSNIGHFTIVGEGDEPVSNLITGYIVDEETTIDIQPPALQVPLVSDTTPPYIVSTSPANGETGVSRSLNQISITFSEPMQPGVDFSVTGTNGEGMSQYWPNNRTLIITIGIFTEDRCTIIFNDPSWAGWHRDIAGNILPTTVIEFFFEY